MYRTGTWDAQHTFQVVLFFSITFFVFCFSILYGRQTFQLCCLLGQNIFIRRLYWLVLFRTLILPRFSWEVRQSMSWLLNFKVAPGTKLGFWHLRCSYHLDKNCHFFVLVYFYESAGSCYKKETLMLLSFLLYFQVKYLLKGHPDLIEEYQKYLPPRSVM